LSLSLGERYHASGKQLNGAGRLRGSEWQYYFAESHNITSSSFICRRYALQIFSKLLQSLLHVIGSIILPVLRQ
jgi:hypothetical protein